MASPEHERANDAVTLGQVLLTLRSLESSESEDWENTRQAVRRLFDRGGVDAIQPLIDQRRPSPAIAAILVELTDHPSDQIRMLDLFSADEIVRGAADYLRHYSDETGYPFKHEWAWEGLWFGGMSDEERWTLVFALIEAAPDDDDALWMIGDGPLSALEMQPGGVDRIQRLTKTHAKLARIRRLVEENP